MWITLALKNAFLSRLELGQGLDVVWNWERAVSSCAYSDWTFKMYIGIGCIGFLAVQNSSIGHPCWDSLQEPWDRWTYIAIEEEMICSISSQTECLPVRTGYFLYTQYLLQQSIFFLNTTQYYILSSLSQLRYIWDMWKIDRSRKRRMNKRRKRRIRLRKNFWIVATTWQWCFEYRPTLCHIPRSPPNHLYPPCENCKKHSVNRKQVQNYVGLSKWYNLLSIITKIGKTKIANMHEPI